VLDQKDEPQPPPPFVHVVAANVGVDTPLLAYTASDGVTVVEGSIEIAFDRFLNPATVNRQGVGLRDLFGNAPDSPIVQYDPITRVAVLSNPNPGQTWLTVGQPYEIVFPVATTEAGSLGLLAIDGASMDPVAPLAFASTQTLGFNVAAAPGSPPPLPPTIDFCSDVMPIFRAPTATLIEGACGTASCHGIPNNTLTTAQGLVLDTEDGIRHTAIGVLAEETATSALTSPLAPQIAFPTGMPIIDPGNPGNSYLMYKLLKYDDGVPDASGATVVYNACNLTTPPFDYGPSGFASTAEATRLSDLIPGRRMPWGHTPLTIDEMERIRLWIAEGAEVDDCTTCPVQP
jgi:hypothetical protein